MLSPAVIEQIAKDYSLGKPTSGYSTEMLEVYHRIKTGFEKFKKDNPDVNAYIDVFGNVDGLPDPE